MQPKLFRCSHTKLQRNGACSGFHSIDCRLQLGKKRSILINQKFHLHIYSYYIIIKGLNRKYNFFYYGTLMMPSTIRENFGERKTKHQPMDMFSFYHSRICSRTRACRRPIPIFPRLPVKTFRLVICWIVPPKLPFLYVCHHLGFHPYTR